VKLLLQLGINLGQPVQRKYLYWLSKKCRCLVRSWRGSTFNFEMLETFILHQYVSVTKVQELIWILWTDRHCMSTW
jgi:hypothetical protein